LLAISPRLMLLRDVLRFVRATVLDRDVLRGVDAKESAETLTSCWKAVEARSSRVETAKLATQTHRSVRRESTLRRLDMTVRFALMRFRLATRVPYSVTLRARNRSGFARGNLY
jgi:hypothetical protein